MNSANGNEQTNDQTAFRMIFFVVKFFLLCGNKFLIMKGNMRNEHKLCSGKGY